MAGDWIKMRADIAEDPAVIGIAATLGLDEFSVVGRLQVLWSWADGQSRDGHARGVTQEWVNRKVQCDNFAQAMCQFGWLEVTEAGIAFPNFDHHNGETAKSRALGTKRKQKQRSSDAEASSVTQTSEEMSRSERDKSETREEKRRDSSSSLRSEEPPRKARSSARSEVTLSEYLELCKAENRKPVPPDHPIRTYCQEAGITDEMRQVAWLVFKDRHLIEPGSKVKPKRYVDWAAAFANSVKDRWYGLWYVSDEGDATWSPDGLQQRRVLDARMAKSREAEHAPA